MITLDMLSDLERMDGHGTETAVTKQVPQLKLALTTDSSGDGAEAAEAVVNQKQQILINQNAFRMKLGGVFCVIQDFNHLIFKKNTP